MLWFNGSISCLGYVIFLVVVPIPVVSKIWYTERVREHVNRSLLPFTLIDNEELLRHATENIIFNWLIYDVGEPIDRKGNAKTGAKKWNSDDGADGRKKNRAGGIFNGRTIGLCRQTRVVVIIFEYDIFCFCTFFFLFLYLMFIASTIAADGHNSLSIVGSFMGLPFCRSRPTISIITQCALAGQEQQPQRL